MSGALGRRRRRRFVEELFATHHGEIYAYLYRMLRDPELAADLTQDAFIKAYRSYDSLEKPENARAWLYQIAHRVALDEFRRRKIVRFLPWTGESHGSAPSAEHLVMDARLSGPLQRALARIPERQRAALLLAELHDLTGLELAAALGVSHVAARAAPHPGPREPPPGARRRACRRGGRRGRDGRGAPDRRGRPERPIGHGDRPMTIRRHNDPQSPHERARTLASDRLDAPLGPTDAGWLDEHLAGCDACRVIAEGYAEDRALLRVLPMQEPPRDLWARTSAALDRERAQRVGLGPGTAGRPTRIRWDALAGLAAVLVVGLLVGRSLLPSGGVPATGQASTGPSAVPGVTLGPAATPLAVPPGDIAWVARSADGRYAVNVASVASVCSPDAAPDCATLDSGARQVISLDQQPDSVVFAPTLGQAVVVESSATGSGGSILVVPFDRPTPTPTPTPSLPPSPEPAATAELTASVEPSASAAPTPVPPATAAPSPSPSASPEPTAEPTPSAPVKSGSPEPTGSASASAPASPSPTDTPAPTAVATLAIISGVIVVGEAAYSPDGAWLAFSARPADGTDGPDIYVWHAGDPAARALTSSHGAIFSSWVGDRILGSAPALWVLDAASPAPNRSVPSSFLVDPATGEETPLGGFFAWRPVVDPSGRWVAYWAGTLRFDPDVRAWVPDEGRLLIDAWSAVTAEDPAASQDPRPLLDPKAGESLRTWDLRWDPAGRHVAVWVADPLVDGLGRISLLAIDPQTGRVDPAGRPVLRDAPSLAGFAIGDGRLAWASPPGQDGAGSRLQVLAWKGPDAGRTTTDPAAPEEDIIVVR